MKHSHSNDDFLKQWTNLFSDDFSKSHQDSKQTNKFDIGSQFEEFLQKRIEKPNNQCSAGCKCNSCLNFNHLMNLDRLNQYTHHNDLLRQNYMSDFYNSHNRSSSCIDNLLAKNLAKYNSPSSPYSPWSCTQCLHNMKDGRHHNQPGAKFRDSQRLHHDPAHISSPHL